jgi:hypothetical protein
MRLATDADLCQEATAFRFPAATAAGIEHVDDVAAPAGQPQARAVS